MEGTGEILEADWTWTGEHFERGVRVAVGEDGRIAAVGGEALGAPRRLAGRVLLPGMVNAHSHAFQRELRGRGEVFLEGSGSFWGWREAMYDLVARLDLEGIYRASRRAFEEMIAAGITTVGEFHYLHHDASCEGFAFDSVVLRAASDAGIRIVLLNAYYSTGGIGRPLGERQRRFRVRSPEDYWERMDVLGEGLDPSTQTLGAVVHSIRAASLEDLCAIHEVATNRGLVFHVHVEEQPKEVEDCRAAYGATPMALINSRLGVSERFTAVHCTHTDPADMEAFLAAAGNVCICPTTEANLADGVPGLARMLKQDARIALGTDSNARICMTEEMRWLEYVQRLTSRHRGVCVDDAGRVSNELFRAATIHGARSLGVPAGSIVEGAWADFMTLDLDTPSLAGWEPDTLLESFVLGTANEAIGEVCVGGRWVR